MAFQRLVFFFFSNKLKEIQVVNEGLCKENGDFFWIFVETH